MELVGNEAIPDPVYICGLELVGLTKEQFYDWVYNVCPSNMPLRKFLMRIAHEAYRVFEEDRPARKRYNPNCNFSPDERPVIDYSTLWWYLNRPAWEAVDKMTPLERLTKLAEIDGGRFAECARRDLERMNSNGNGSETRFKKSEPVSRNG